MSLSPAQHALIFAVDTLFSAYIFLVLFRLLLQIARADFYNPLSQLVVKLTNPVLVPLRRFIPSAFGLDMASIVLMVLLKVTEIILLQVLTGKLINMAGPSLLGLLSLTLGQLLHLLLVTYLYMIVISIIFSWISMFFGSSGIHQLSFLLNILQQITYPILKRCQKILPPISGLDISPMLAIFGLTFLDYLLSGTLVYYGSALIKIQAL